MSIIVQSGDTLDSLGRRYNISANDLMHSNCLFSSNLVAGSQLWVPAVIPNTQVACIPGSVGWVKYVAQPGDNLYRIAVNHSTTLDTLKLVNCRAGDQLLAGEVLWVPNVPTRTPTPTALPGKTITPYPTEPLTQTPLPFTATVIPSNTSIPPTSTPVPTSTPIPTFTASPTPFPQQP
jgi:LysM repeat protein